MPQPSLGKSLGDRSLGIEEKVSAGRRGALEETETPGCGKRCRNHTDAEVSRSGQPGDSSSHAKMLHGHTIRTLQSGK